MKVLAILIFLNVVAKMDGATYTTNFPLSENPISESGNWINGGVVGLDWTNVRTTPGMAIGTQAGTAAGNPRYADSTAVLSGVWGPDQTAQATIVVIKAADSPTVYEEVELRLRTTVTANSITGYEINCSVSINPHLSYVQIVRWNGPLGSFKVLKGFYNAHAANGDVLKATILGSTISLYLNGQKKIQVTDDTYKSGSPGIGFFLQGATGLDDHYGLADFSATDGLSPNPTATPNLPTPKAKD